MSDDKNSEGGRKPARASAGVVARRVEEILRVILDGAEECWDLCEYVREKEQETGSVWEVQADGKPLSDSQIRRYVAKADELIAESCRASRKKLLRRHLAKRRNLYAKAVSQGDVKAALAVLRDEAELLGIYAPRKIAPTSPDGKKAYAALGMPLDQFDKLDPAQKVALLRSGAELGESMIDASLHRRAAYRRHIESNGLQRAELSACCDDIAHWVNQWGYTYDPRGEVKALPFDLFPKQVEFLGWLAERQRLREDGLVEKSRDMGATFLCCAHALHRWLFFPGFSAGFGSRKLELVDRIGDLDSIFEKVRFMLYGLPSWMLPEKFDRKRHDNQARLVNPSGGSSLTGEGGANIGRGGRKTMYFVDEAAFLERPELADRSLFGNTEVRIDVSTPNGPGNPFAQKRFSGKVKVFTLYWRDDPRKDDAWYAKVKAEKDEVTVAQEVEMDYTASIEGICIPAAWVRAAVGLALPPGPRVAAGLDVGEYGSDPSVFIPRAGPVAGEPVAWGKCNTTETAWRARDEAVRSKAEAVCYDAGGVGAGVRGAWETAEALPFAAQAVLFGESATDDYWPDGKTSKEKFLNLRAEMWWKLRIRFEKAYEFVEKKVAHPPEEMISIPNHPRLIAELSMPLAERTENGKIRIESKDRMRARGVKSPNFADALATAFHAEAYGPWDPTPDPAARLEVCKAPRGVFIDHGREGIDDDPEGDGVFGLGVLIPPSW